MTVNVTNANTAYRLQRVFKNETYLMAQVRGTANVVISHDQGGALNGVLSLGSPTTYSPDGLVLNASNSAPPNALWADWFWSGELWYAADQDGAQWSLEIGTETSQRRSASVLKSLAFLFA